MLRAPSHPTCHWTSISTTRVGEIPHVQLAQLPIRQPYRNWRLLKTKASKTMNWMVGVFFFKGFLLNFRLTTRFPVNVPLNQSIERASPARVFTSSPIQLRASCEPSRESRLWRLDAMLAKKVLLHFQSSWGLGCFECWDVNDVKPYFWK